LVGSCRPPCKSVVKRKQNSPDARYGGARKIEHAQNPRLATCASRRWFLPLAEPDIHLLSPAPEGLLRRLSLCSLPVPKQSEGSLGSLRSFCSVGHLRDLAACASCNPDLFFPTASVFSKPPPCFSVRKEGSPFLGDRRRADTRPSFELRPRWRDSRCPSVFLVHGLGPARGCV